MAIAMYNSLHHTLSIPVITPNHPSTRRSKKSLSKLLMMCSNNNVSVSIQTGSFHKIKVFEDRSSGIVCYKDENGEIVCEGYDEGPRFHHQLPRLSLDARDVEIIDLLQRCWLHVADEHELANEEKGVIGQADLNCNGSNTLF